jgi:hypothetical protein
LLQLSPTEGEEQFSRLDSKLSDVKVTAIEPLKENKNQISQDTSNIFPSQAPHHEPEKTTNETIEKGNMLKEELSDNKTIFKENLFNEEAELDEEPTLVPQEQILSRINSKKGMTSYQLGKQLSSKWCTGAGPRIGCVRDYPSELQLLALEQVNLSPRCAGPSRFGSPRFGSPQVGSPQIRSPRFGSPRFGSPQVDSPRFI